MLAIALAVFCTLSPVARAETVVEVATVGPGDEAWERFGHVLLRVTDTKSRRDDVYDLGAAEFGGPRFAWSFFYGRELFYATVAPWSARLNRFRERERDVVVQRLALGGPELERLRADLAALRSELRTRLYIYDHVRDNCATRLRDLLDRVSDGAIRRAAATLSARRTYREYTLEGEAGRIDALLFLDLIVGPQYDRQASGWDALYLPSQLAEALALARTSDAPDAPSLVSSTRVANRRTLPSPQRGSPAAGRRLAVGSSLAFAVLCIASAIVSRGRDRRLARATARSLGAALVVVGALFGLAGFVLWTLAAFSRVPDLAWSDNALLFLPFDLVWIVYGWSRVRSGTGRARPLPSRFLDTRLVLLAAIVGARALGLLQQDNVAFLICAASVFLGLRIAEPRSFRSTSGS